MFIFKKTKKTVTAKRNIAEHGRSLLHTCFLLHMLQLFVRRNP